MKEERFQIRYAGGTYWLLDMEQNGLDYKIPHSLNETGVYIYTKLQEGEVIEQIAEDMQKDFGVDKEEALSDIKVFVEQMIKKGIIREE